MLVALPISTLPEISSVNGYKTESYFAYFKLISSQFKIKVNVL